MRARFLFAGVLGLWVASAIAQWNTFQGFGVERYNAMRRLVVGVPTPTPTPTSTPTPDTSPPTGVANSSPADEATDVAVEPTLTFATATDDTPPIQYYGELYAGSACSGGTSQTRAYGTSTTWAPTTLASKTQYSWRNKAKDAVSPTPNESSYGTCTQFTTLDNEAPTGVGNSSPADEATDVSVEPTLTANTASDASTPIQYYFRLYEGAACSGSPSQTKAYSTATTFAPTTLAASTQYSWENKAKDAATTPNESAYGTCTQFTTTSGSYAEDCTGAALCWKMDEASGDIVDEIAGVTLADQGSPVYSVTATAPYDLISPGITMATSNYFRKLTATNEAAFTDTTVEIFFKTTASASTNDQEYLYANLITEAPWYPSCFAARFYSTDTFRVISGDGSGSDFDSWDFTLDTDASHDTDIHKLRIVIDRSDSVDVFFDGVSLTPQATSARFKGWSLSNCPNAAIGSYPTGAYYFPGTIYTVRQTHNATANMGGPGGG